MISKEKWKISFGAINCGDIEIGDERGDIVVTVETMRRRYHKDAEKAWATANAIEAVPAMLQALGAIKDECVTPDTPENNQASFAKIRNLCFAALMLAKVKT